MDRFYALKSDVGTNFEGKKKTKEKKNRETYHDTDRGKVRSLRCRHARVLQEPFVDIMKANSCPETKSVRASNVCRISFYKVPNTQQLVILSVIDNLVKGAAGQALQNMNIMMGWQETLGLELIPLTP